MIWIVIISLLLAVGAIVYAFCLRRQILEICRQLAFLESNDSQLEVTLQFPTGSFRKLQKAINSVLHQQRQKLWHALEEEKQMRESLTDLSHDIRTPLTSLDGYFQLLQTTEDSEKQKRYAGIIQERIAVLRELLEALFTYTKLQDGSERLECSRGAVNPVLLHALLSFHPECKARGLEPEILVPETPIQAFFEPTALQRVVQNVLKNALMHGSTDAPYLQVVLEEERKRVCIRITNRCPHPETIDMERIFDRFYRSDRARTNTGTGLGLSIAHGLITQMEGSMTAQLDGDLFTIAMKLPK